MKPLLIFLYPASLVPEDTSEPAEKVAAERIAGPKPSLTGPENGVSACERRLEQGIKEFLNRLGGPYSITYCSSVTGPGNAPSPRASRIRCHKPCFSHNS